MCLFGLKSLGKGFSGYPRVYSYFTRPLHAIRHLRMAERGSKEVKNVELDLDLTKCSPEPKGVAPDRAEPAGGCINTSETPPKPAHRAARISLSAGSSGTHSNYARAHLTGEAPRQPRAPVNKFWAPQNAEPNDAELLLYALLIVRAYPRQADREEWLSYLLTEAGRALEARGG